MAYKGENMNSRKSISKRFDERENQLDILLKEVEKATEGWEKGSRNLVSCDFVIKLPAESTDTVYRALTEKRIAEIERKFEILAEEMKKMYEE